MMNLFFISGHIAAIAACIVAEKYYQSEENILVHEISDNKMHSDRFQATASDYYDICRIIIDAFPWSQVIELTQKRTITHFSSVRHPRIEYVDVEKLKKDIKNKIPNLDAADKLIASDNSSTWKLFFRGQCKLHMIEHGASMYKRNYLFKMSDNIFRKIRKKISSFLMLMYTRTNQNKLYIPPPPPPQKVYLTDCGESFTVRNADKLSSKIDIESIHCKGIVQNLCAYVAAEYARQYPHDYHELLQIKRRMDNYKNKYIYLPQDIVDLDNYSSYLRTQLSKVDTEGALFLIKKHTRDKANYDAFFKKDGHECLSIQSARNGYLPVEILLYLLDYPTLVSSYSSSLLYAKWWLDQSPVFAEVVESCYNDTLIKEYSGTYQDFQAMAQR